MKRLIAVLSGLLVLPAFAEVAPEYYYAELMAQYADEMPGAEFVTDEIDQESEQETDETAAAKPVTPSVPTAVSPRNTSGRSAASRAIVSNTTTSAPALFASIAADNPAAPAPTMVWISSMKRMTSGFFCNSLIMERMRSSN